MDEALGKEREALLAKVSQLEEDAGKAKQEFDDQVAKLSEQLRDAQKAVEKEVEARVRLAKEKEILEVSALDDESEDTAGLNRSGL